MSRPGGLPRDAGDPPGAAGAPRSLSVLTFEAGDHLLGISSREVESLLASAAGLPEGASVVDAVGLLPRLAPGGPRERRRGCYVLLASRAPGGARVAIASSRAGEIRVVEPGRLLPLPGFLFPGENPFMGLIPPVAGGPRRPVFVVAGPERLLACAGAR